MPYSKKTARFLRSLAHSEVPFKVLSAHAREVDSCIACSGDDDFTELERQTAELIGFDEEELNGMVEQRQGELFDELRRLHKTIEEYRVRLQTQEQMIDLYQRMLNGGPRWADEPERNEQSEAVQAKRRQLERDVDTLLRKYIEELGLRD